MDYIVRMIAKGAPIVAMAIQGHDLVNRAQEIHTRSCGYRSPRTHLADRLHDGGAAQRERRL